MAFGYNAYWDIQELDSDGNPTGDVLVLNGPEHNLTGATWFIANALNRKASGGSQSEQEQSDKEQLTASFSINIDDDTRPVFMITTGTHYRVNHGANGNGTGRLKETADVTLENVVNLGDDDVTSDVTLHPQTVVTPGVF